MCCRQRHVGWVGWQAPSCCDLFLLLIETVHHMRRDMLQGQRLILFFSAALLAANDFAV
jgi:hypothetical protein